MKKILMGTSAIAMTGAFGGEAQAVEWDLDWGGYFNAFAVYTSEDDVDGSDGFDILTDAEIIFTPEVVLDNGLTFGAKVEMEAEADGSSQSGVIDESVAYVEGSFGRVELGAEDSVFARMLRGGGGSYTRGMTGAYSATMTGTFLGGPDTGIGYGAAGNQAQIAGDAVRINYFTPRFAGFQAGVSYARGGSKNDRFFENTDTDVAHIWGVGANYVNTFGGVDLALSAAYEDADDPAGADLARYNAGIALGVAGFTVGGSYAHYEGSDVDFFDIGVAYDTGPWGVSFGYTFDDGGNEVDQYVAGVQYQLGPGVTLAGSAGYADSDGTGVDGFVVGTGFKLSF